MTTAEAKEASPSKLFSHVFGRKPGQTVAEFAKEILPLREDSKFVEEVREYAIAHAS